MNYFNYFTEIEDAFIRRRGKHLLLSPMDWALIESWKEMGVPLHVALSGIERSFDSYESKPRKRSVKSLMYCQEEVEAQFAEWHDSQLGAQQKTDESVSKNGGAKRDRQADARLPFPRETILAHLAHARLELKRSGDERQRRRGDELSDALARVATRLEELEDGFAKSSRPDAEKLEAALTSLEKILDAALRTDIPPQELAAARAGTEAQLEPYRNRMEQATYEQTLDNLLMKRLRDQHQIPRLSLFYL